MLPGLFISHGSPMLALIPGPAHDFLRRLGHELAPTAILVVGSGSLTHNLAERQALAAPRPA